MKFVGLAGFALQHPNFPVGRFLRVYKNVENPATAVLWSTFGTSIDGLKTFCDDVSDRPHVVEIHLSNEVGRKNGRLFQGEFLPQTSTTQYNQFLTAKDVALETQIKNRVMRIQTKANLFSNPNTRILLSIGLEHQFTVSARRTLIEWCRESWPTIELVNNPLLNAPIKDGNLLELHGTHPNFGSRREESISNLDGVSVNTGDGETYNPYPRTSISLSEAKQFLTRTKTSQVRLLWSASLQGLRDGSFKPPRQREFLLSGTAIREINKLLTDI
jgi:hypothetical protein